MKAPRSKKVLRGPFLLEKKPPEPGRQKKPESPLTALVFSGGGARGAYECGVYQSLHEHGVRPSVLVGTSVGAVNAAAICQGMSPWELRELWLRISSADWWYLPGRLRPLRTLMGDRHTFRNRLDLWNFFGWNHLFDTEPMLATFRKYFDVEKIRKSRVKLYITAVDVISGESSIFTNKTVVPEHVLASSSIPIAFPWTEVDGRIYWDGGLLANIPPIKIAIDADRRVREIYLVRLFPRLAQKPDGLLDCIERTIELVLQGVLNNEIDQVEFINRLIRSRAIRGVYREINLHTVEFHEPFSALSILDFSKRHVERLIDQGYRDTERMFARKAEERDRKRRVRLAARA
ncbi:MAG: patatin-like phospholipase family protein [Candidatus Wallbacteria bacterium]|nr:patatin-like phospholipase family protein [Candidatus Wallbacteria bacterium]